MREKIIKAIEKEKIIVIVRGVARKQLIPLAEAMYAGGIRLLEITYSADGAMTDEETAKNIEMLSDFFHDRMYIGAGTVLNQVQVELTKEAGGKFIISPDTFPEVIERTRGLGMVSIPGAFTPSEIQTAHREGADFVKVFPISNMGMEYVQAVKAPLSHIKLLAVGGVNEEKIKRYLQAGIAGFGIGSNIVNKKLIEEDKYLEITKRAKRYVAKVMETL